MKVEVVEYNPDWKRGFNTEKLLLTESLGDLLTGIHHIGSTSVPDLAAKPIIDIIIEVYSLNLLGKLTPKMELLGYVAKGEFGIPGRRYFTKGGSNRTHQIHAFESGDPNVHRHTAFRDYLKSHPSVLQKYADLKKRLAKICNNDIDLYCAGKDEFIKDYELKAIAWVKST
jgi:GrpB-like predicted nucleotidyltransferase (UPF0157 family)